jgi:hypothetical protein
MIGQIRRLRLSPGQLAADGRTPREKGDVLIAINRNISKKNARSWSALETKLRSRAATTVVILIWSRQTKACMLRAGQFQFPVMLC